MTKVALAPKHKTLIAVGILVLIGLGAYAVTRGGSERGGGSSVVAEVKQDTGSGTAAAAAPIDSKATSGPPVEVAQARSAQAVTELQSVGTLASDESVAIATEVVGRIASLNFQEGAAVKAGDVLVTLDNLLATADLAFVEANLKLARSNYERATSLSKTGAGTARALDEAKAALDTASAAYELARVRRDKTEIRAPFDGVVGLRQVSVGAYAQVGQVIVNLEKIDTLKLDFRLPEVNLRDVKVDQKVEIGVDAIPDRKFEGTVYAIDPLIDANGRALKIRARLSNPDNVLRPGLFARVNLRGAPRGEVVLIPEGAIVPRGTDSFVFTVEDGKAVESKVRLGRRSAGEVEILEGLKPDATVVIAGQGRIRNGEAVSVVASRQRS